MDHFTEMCFGTETGSNLRLIHSCITQLKAQGPSGTCNESKEEVVMDLGVRRGEGRNEADLVRGADQGLALDDFVDGVGRGRHAPLE